MSCKFVLLFVLLVAQLNCSSKKDGEGSAKNYEFSTSAKVSLSNGELTLAGKGGKPYSLAEVEDTCDGQPNYICSAPSVLTGKYYSVGLLIQAGGQGMQSYLLADNWKKIKASDETYDFDAGSPIVSKGDLICCGGNGDLTGDNVYFSDVSYMFGYLDATFKIPYTTAQESTVSAEMRGDHTVRFVLASGIEDKYVRGDVLYKDVDSKFKWMDKEGVLSATRPDKPITLSDDIVDYVNPFSELEDAEIPVLYSGINETSKGLNVTSEAGLKKSGRTYSFDFDTSKFVVIMMGQDQLSLLQTKKDLLQKLHIQGMKNDALEFGKSGNSTLTID